MNGGQILSRRETRYVNNNYVNKLCYNHDHSLLVIINYNMLVNVAN